MRSRTLLTIGAVLAVLAILTTVVQRLGGAGEAERGGQSMRRGDDLISHGAGVMIGDEPPEEGEQQNEAARTRPATGAPVSVGLYIMDISHINFAEGTYSLDGYVWMNWDPAKFLAPGAESTAEGAGLPRAPCDTIGFVGAFELNIQPIVKNPGYAQFRVIGTIRQDFHLARFPLDHHVLRLGIEDEEHADHIVRYEADVRNSGTSDFHITGWTHDRLTVSTYTRIYSTNFGDLSLPTGNQSHFSGIAFEIPIRQVRVAYFIKLTFGLFISTMLALMSLVVAHYGVDRLGFPVGALFAVVASQWVVGEALPPRSPPTIADWLHVTSFCVILTVTLVNVRSLRVLEDGDLVRSKAIDRFWFRVIAPTWVCLCVLICVLA
ncbi:MAG: hypothetical protein FJ254_03690 [Phycisphaerae bacterium]|nr:hypothetical protein [Phycisphaerae bacterium]